MRFPLEVFAAVREAWPEHKPISVRISATDWVPGGFDGDDAVAFARELKALGCDIVDVSTGQTTIDADPDYGRLYQTPYSDRIRHEAGIPTMTVGAVSSIDDVHNILVSGRADLCVLARPHLVDPYWTLNAAIDLGYADFDFPNQYLSGLNARRRVPGPDSTGCVPGVRKKLAPRHRGVADCTHQRKEVVLGCMKVFGLWRWSSAERR